LASHKLTRHEILADWPPVCPPPDDITLYRWLERAVSEGLLARDGKGRRNSPFRYWLPEIMFEWLKDPLYQIRYPEPVDWEN
jgi:hypothetical protein